MGPKETVHFNFEMSAEFANDWTSGFKHTLTFQVAQPVKSGYTAMCIGVTRMGTYDGDYESDVHITLNNGKTFDFKERGHANQIMYGSSSQRCDDEEGDHSDQSPSEFVGRSQRKRDVEKRVPTVLIA